MYYINCLIMLILSITNFYIYKRFKKRNIDGYIQKVLSKVFCILAILCFVLKGNIIFIIFQLLTYAYVIYKMHIRIKTLKILDKLEGKE